MPRKIDYTKPLTHVVWRREVLRRDNYTCMVCGDTSSALHAHHIKPYADYPELCRIVSNGTTLCAQCHKEAHRKGWRRCQPIA